MRADEDALLLHHARHGRERDERRDQEEDEREYLRDALNALGIADVALRADVLGAVEYVPARALDRIDSRLRVVELPGGIGELGLRL